MDVEFFLDYSRLDISMSLILGGAPRRNEKFRAIEKQFVISNFPNFRT